MLQITLQVDRIVHTKILYLCCGHYWLIIFSLWVLWTERWVRQYTAKHFLPWVLLDHWEEVGVLHGLQGSQSLLVIVPADQAYYASTLETLLNSVEAGSKPQDTRLRSLSRKSRASGDTRCWFSEWTKRSHLGECIVNASFEWYVTPFPAVSSKDIRESGVELNLVLVQVLVKLFSTEHLYIIVS